ncbi:MAG: nucleotide disphospho-sugar-binding domain-containing protein [Thermoleophilaceae bacterium]
MANIAVVHVPFYSHIEAATRLSGALVRQGHSVIAWGPERSRATIEASGARFVLHTPEMPHVDTFMAHVASLAATTEEATTGLVDELHEHEIDLIIHDSQVPWARVAGDYLGLPRIVSYPMFPIAANRAIPSDFGEGEEPAPTSEEALEGFEASWRAIALRWGVELGDWNSVIHTAGESETTLTFTTQEILGDYELRPGWHCIGPLMDAPPPRAPRPERPLVYVCFGTSFNARYGHFMAAIEGLADEPVDVLVSTGGGPMTKEHLPPLPANVTVHEFAPGREVLARASLHVTHGGNNSVNETLLAGVPMLLMPQAWDQWPLAGRVEGLGAGLIADESADAVRTAARWLLEDDRITARARELGRHLAGYDGAGRVADAVDHVLDGDLALSA